MPFFNFGDARIHYVETGRQDGPVFVWAHGWGQSHAVFLPMVQSVEHMGRHILLDLPGFGASPPPGDIWGTADYADAMAALLQSLGHAKVTWIGHSFGCRVGLQLAARHPNMATRLFLIAAAGLKRKRSLLKRSYMKCRIYLFKTLKYAVPDGAFKQKLYGMFGSADYKSAGPMRGIFVKTVNEDLTCILKSISCPAMLIYGENDTETPPEIGQRLKDGIDNAQLILMPDHDHYSVLNAGRHQILAQLKSFAGGH